MVVIPEPSMTVGPTYQFVHSNTNHVFGHNDGTMDILVRYDKFRDRVTTDSTDPEME